MVPFDKKSALVTSGIRIGTPALTSRGMKESEMEKVAYLINEVLLNIDNEPIIQNVRMQVLELCTEFPLYGELLENEMSKM